MQNLITLVCFLIFAGSAFGSTASTAEEIDPVAVSPGLYKVLLENEHVRIVEYQLKPGEKDNWHTHPAKASYVMSGGTLRINTQDGESFVVNEETGTASWFGTLGKHFAENISDTPVRILLIEVKSARKSSQP